MIISYRPLEPGCLHTVWSNAKQTTDQAAAHVIMEKTQTSNLPKNATFPDSFRTVALFNCPNVGLDALSSFVQPENQPNNDQLWRTAISAFLSHFNMTFWPHPFRAVDSSGIPWKLTHILRRFPKQRRNLHWAKAHINSQKDRRRINLGKYGVQLWFKLKTLIRIKWLRSNSMPCSPRLFR